MLQKIRKFSQFFLLMACIFTAFLNVGGNYWHDIVHHHDEQDPQDECFFYHLLAQAFHLIWAFVVFLFLKTKVFPIFESSIAVIDFKRLLPYLRAPPVFVSSN